MFLSSVLAGSDESHIFFFAPMDQNNTVNETELIITINSPANETYTIPTSILNATMNLFGNMWYSVDDGVNNTVCDNCTGFETEISLTDGSHEIMVYGNSSGLQNSSSIVFTIDATGPGVNVLSPKNITYDHSAVKLNVTTDEIVDTLWHSLDGVVEILCNDCDEYNDTLNVSEGSHYITVYANDTVGNANSTSVTFTVDTTAPTISIISPTNTTYNNATILVNITSDGDNVWFFNGTDNETYTTPVYRTFSEGSNTLIAYANDSFGNENSHTVYFSVNTTPPFKPPPFKPIKKWPFSIGYNHLPRMYENGDVSEEELIGILQENKLNPGVLNRLIKTGKLSEEAIDVIIDTQFLPVGILDHLLWLFGFDAHNKLIDNLYNQYNLTDDQFSIILNKHRIPPGTMKHMMSSKLLTESQIDILVEKKDLDQGSLKVLVKTQTLTQDNIEEILKTQEVSTGSIKDLIKNQMLNEENINIVVNKTDNPSVLTDIIDNQNLTHEQKNEVIQKLPTGLQKKYNLTSEEINTTKGYGIGKQKKPVVYKIPVIAGPTNTTEDGNTTTTIQPSNPNQQQTNDLKENKGLAKGKNNGKGNRSNDKL